MRQVKFGLILAGLLSVSSMNASAFTVIDFDTDANGNDIVDGQEIDDEYAAWGVTISAENIRKSFDRAVAFDSSLDVTSDPDLEAPFYDFIQEDFTDVDDKNEFSFVDDVRDGVNGISNPGNVLIIQENNTGCDGTTCDDPDDEGRRPAGFFTISFDVPVFLSYIDFFDIEIAEDGGRPENAIILKDADSKEISPSTFFTPNTGGDFIVGSTSYTGTGADGLANSNGRTNAWDRLFFNTAQVKMITINMGGSGAIDNIAFREVPSPATGALLLLGALMLWRRTAEIKG